MTEETDRAVGVRAEDGGRGILVLGAETTDPATVGHKAARLGRSVADGFRVPAGVVLPVSTIAPLLRAAGDRPSVERVHATDPPESLRRAVADAVAFLGDGPLAVRSSSVAEDTEEASYAGLYETVLGVIGPEDTVDAVRRCVASAFAARVSGYGGTTSTSTEVAVLIQRQIDPAAAGVAFTANPVTGGRDEVRVSAVRGLGDRLVSGQASPDEWLVRDGDAVCLAAPEGAIDAGMASEIARLARRIEEQADGPQDIEWAVRDGQIHLLQARPITALPVAPERTPPPGTWMKDTTHYQGPMSPLAATAYLPRLEAGGNRAFGEFGLLMGAIHQAAIGWEVYVQAVPPDPQLAEERIATAVESLRTDRPDALVEEWWSGGWREGFLARFERLRAVPREALDDEALDAHLDECLDLLAEGQVIHFQLFVPYLLAAFDLATAGEELLGWSFSETLELVAGLSEASARATVELAAIAGEFRSVPTAAEVLAAWNPGQPFDEVVLALREIEPALAGRLIAHRERHGCRVPAYDVGDPTDAERPELILRLLRDLLAGTHDPLAVRAELDLRRERAVERARASLVERGATAEEGQRFEQVLARAQRAWGLREDNLVVTDHMPNGLLRWTALEIGRRLVSRGLLRRPDEVVWLELGELRSAHRGEQDSDLRERVSRRRAEHAWVRAHPGPALHGEPPPPPPPLDGLPPEAQRLNGALGWMMAAEYASSEGADGDDLHGVPGSPGRTTGTARIVRDETEFDRLGVDEVLVCRLTTPAWTALFGRAAAVVTDIGSPLSHAAIVAREHGIPAVVGVGDATTRIEDGQLVSVDGSAGRISPVDDPGTPFSDGRNEPRGRQ